jgi:GNAT superfamily N-acetyltransferase
LWDGPVLAAGLTEQNAPGSQNGVGHLETRNIVMALNSVNTNVGAQIALQNLQVTNKELGTVQNRINTGKIVSSAKDNGAIFAIATGQRAEIGALNAVKDSLNRGQSAVDVSLAAGAIVLAEVPASLRRNMPNPLPVVMLGRLAVDRNHQGLGLGRALVAHAIRLSLQAQQLVGARALLVHAIDDQAAAFYRRMGFRPSPISRLILLLQLHPTSG